MTRVVEDAALADDARATAVKIAAGPTTALGAIKHLLAAQGGVSFANQLDAELNEITIARASADAHEGIAVFLKRRAPNFTGA
ncbi:hypothetical protein G4G27_17275 [Sphingomonas sp. So64.6b]|uniref:hypothetical protein n=1 Tax=Sphingomonas sp. So64.6b TaxID=2997354 RepID=UPI001862079B|nr:hypothetical protein [Sphingomonas sp. So64.6b]QNA85538.1 hypothetical protein G4G27_17275 [Sphingomonas sp. So64.6b]